MTPTPDSLPDRSRRTHFPGHAGTFLLGEADTEFRKTATIRARQVHESFVVEAMEGDHSGKPGDWLAQGPAGELWVIDKDVFAATYAPLEESP
jgi:hypothetical protein